MVGKLAVVGLQLFTRYQNSIPNSCIYVRTVLKCCSQKASSSCWHGNSSQGLLQKGTVAVKKLSQTFEVDEKKFNQEFESLMRVKHKNIVRFLGYCADTQGKVCKFEGKNVMAEERQRLLCFEFMPKGSLDKYIKGTSSHLICSIYSKINQLLKLATLNLINL